MMPSFTRADVQHSMERVTPQESYSDEIAQELSQTVYGQEDACKAVGRRMALFESGLSDPNRPLGSIFELGPSGVGKTEMAHAASKYMFGDPDSERLKIINMSEMTEKHYITRFVGSPPSYVGYKEQPLIPHDWLHNGRSIIVLDEFEKAHPAVQQLWLGVLDKGKMDSRKGEAGAQPLDFRQSLLFFTANIGGKEMHDIAEGGNQVGFASTGLTAEQKTRQINQVAQRGLENTLSPEFINRLDDIVIFQEIRDRAIFNNILSKFIAERNGFLRDKLKGEAPYFGVTDEFRKYILDTVGNKGGRELKRQLERDLFDKAADVFMGFDVTGRPLVADFDDDEQDVVFYTDELTLKEDGEKNKVLETVGREDVQRDISPSEPPEDEGGTSREKIKPENPLKDDRNDLDKDSMSSPKDFESNRDPGDEHHDPPKKPKNSLQDINNDGGNHTIFVNVGLTLQHEDSNQYSWVSLKMPVEISK